MSADAADLARMKREALVARSRMNSTLGAVKQRLAPSTLAEQAREKMRLTTSAVTQKASAAVRSRPNTVAAVAAAAGLILFRKPVGRLLKALVGRDARQRRRTRRMEKRAATEAARAGSELPPSDLIPPPDTDPAAASFKKE